METGKQWKGRTGGGNFGLRFLISTLSAMPLWCAYLLLEVGLPFHLLFNPRYFRSTRHYFSRRLGYGRFAAWRAAYATHRQFGRMMFDRFRFFRSGGKGYTVRVEDEDLIRKLASSCGGLVIGGSHVGSMEMAGYMLGLKELPINAIVFGGENAYLQQWRRGVLGEGGVKMIPVSADLSHLFIAKAALDKGECVSMPCDRVYGSNKCAEVDFLGAKASFPIGAFTLAAQLEKEMVLLFCMKEGRRGYNVITRHITVDRVGKGSRKIALELVEKYAEVLEEIVRRYPTQWFNFYEFWKEDGDNRN